MRKLALALLLAGCADSLTPPERPDLSGDWTYNAIALTSGDVLCNAQYLNLSLRQAGHSFVGQTSGGTLQCWVGSLLVLEAVVDDRLVGRGLYVDSVVRFEIGPAAGWKHEARMVGADAMQGTAIMTVGFHGAPLALSGPFTAVRY